MKMNCPKVIRSSFLFAFIFGVARFSAADYASTVTNTPNLLGYWRFDPVFQTNSLVNGYTGMLQGNAQIGPPQSGCPLSSDAANQALLLDGAGSYFTTSLTGGITNQGSILVWVYLTNQPSVAGHVFEIVAQSQSGNDLDFQINPDNTTQFYTDSGGSVGYNTPLPLNQWHFLAATFIANSARAIYLDGQPVATNLAGGHSLNPTAFWIGNNRVFGPRLFEGRLDEVALFSRALSASEVAAIYSAAAPPKLSITPLTNAVLLTWPTNFPGFKIETNGSLNTNISPWGTLTTTYGTISTNYAFTNAVGPTKLFYRLKK